MPDTDTRLRSMRRELLIARATLEREELLQHMDELRGRSRPAQLVAHAASSGMQRLRDARLAGIGGSTVRILMRHPWLLASLLSMLRRGRVLRLGMLAAAAGGAAWWWSRQRALREQQSELPFDVRASDLDDLGI